ncbi:hypothetical protein RN001_003693 [Aquatica leii]|uniref:SWIM-type domain-containing protein n=1 Tax=Aquatica leii TaxID=1421715 RepID=A0AAN7Q9T2_9COLE|nr:hypothetical protein RN001_003693 [Aquatica leii]
MARNPVISFACILSYFDEKKLIAKGENAFNSGHVQQVQFDKELGILRVLASTKKKTYKVEVSIGSNEITKCTCDCPRGLDICHHMCALAFFGLYNISVTDLACSWRVHKQKNDYVQTAEELIPLSNEMANYKAIKEDVSSEQINTFYNNIKEYGPTGVCWLLSPEPEIKSNGVGPTKENPYPLSTSKENVRIAKRKLPFSERMGKKLKRTCTATSISNMPPTNTEAALAVQNFLEDSGVPSVISGELQMGCDSDLLTLQL